MKKILFVDCETTGKPIDYNASYTQVDNWPRVIALAFILCDEEGNVLHDGNYLIKPDGWEVPNEPFWIENGLTQEKNMAEGFPIEGVLLALMELKKEADILVAHNIRFDHRVIWSEFIRNGMTPKSGLHKICTMMKGTALCRIPGKNGRGIKWPTLTELHTFLFGVAPEVAHDAGADVRACKECFFEMLKLGALDLVIPEAKVV